MQILLHQENHKNRNHWYHNVCGILEQIHRLTIQICFHLYAVVHNNRFCKNHEKIPIQSGSAIHAFSDSPTQFAPLPKGAGFVQVLLWV